MLGHGNRAFETYRLTCPSYTKDQTLHRTEPYVYAQTIAGPDATRFGEAKNSWLTGTAAWCFYAVSQAILGVKPAYDGLTIDPCLPEDMKELTLTRRWRGNTYIINITNEGNGEKKAVSLTMDGTALADTLIPATLETGKVFHVLAVVK